MNRWPKLLAALVVSFSLIGAPCKNCEPKPAKDQPAQCQHDCCPKSKPAKQACKWQPADFAAVEAKQELQTAPELDFVALVLESAPRAASYAVFNEPRAQAEPPPLYLSHRQLRN